MHSSRQRDLLLSECYCIMKYSQSELEKTNHTYYRWKIQVSVQVLLLLLGIIY